MAIKKDKKEYVKTYKGQKIYYSSAKKIYITDLNGLTFSL